MKILGLAFTSHNDSVALVNNAELVNHFQLERFTKFYKNHSNDSAVYSNINKQTCMYIENLIKRINNIDYYAISYIDLEKSKFKVNFFNNLLNCDIRHIRTKLPTKLGDYNIINDNVYYIDHHQAHAAYARYTAPFENADVLAYGNVRNKFQSIFVDSENNIHDCGVLSKDPSFFIGQLWFDLSKSFFKDNFNAKGMELSAYGNVNQNLLEFFYEVSERVSAVEVEKLSLFDNICKIFNIPNVKYNIEEKYIKDLFATLQHFSTEYVIDNLKKHKTSDNLCISGGVALNGYINEEILKRKIYKKIHVPPAATNEGQSIGCALHALYHLEGKKIKTNNPNKIMYLSNSFKMIKNDDDLYMDDDKLCSFIAKKISEGYVIGWFQGKGESGSRGLGNRSILADPRNPKMKNHLINNVKKMEWYRPFGPSILQEEVSKWFVINGNKESPFMTRIMNYKKNKENLIPAVCHIDNTARVQTVTKDINLKFYTLIKEFNKITKVPLLLNTSFSSNNEPIVESPTNALNFFNKNNIDILVLENYVYFRNNDKNIKPLIDEINENE